ncbi:MAG: ATP-binding protein, partial [Actinobacteria bacterium]|nr:ATP-binding protein [Actinomycetota bacterium]
IPSVVLVGITFHPVQEGIRKKLDHLLFPALVDLDREVESASRSIPQLREVEDIAGDVLERLVRCLRVEWATIRIEDAEDHHPMVFTRRGTSAGAHGPLSGSVREPTGDGGPMASEPASMQRPLVASGETIGTLLLGSKLEDLEVLPIDERLVSLLSPLAATALRNGLLIRRLNSQVQALAEREEKLAALSLRLMHAQEEEAKKIALDIHDDPLQRAILLARRIGESPGDARAKEWAVEVDEVITSLRAICNSIRLPILDDFGLVKGLEWLVNNFRARSELEINFSREASDEGILEQLHQDLQIAIYRIAQEALQNCLKHSNATRIEVVLRATKEAAGLVISDNGRGYSRRSDGERLSAGLGITGMRERLRPWGGSLYIESAEGGGTIVRVEVRRA